MSLRDQLNQDLKEAMRARDSVRLTVIRGVKAAVTEAETRRERVSLDDDHILGIIAKEVKERREVISEFQRVGRTDLVEKAEQEILVLSGYLPKPLSSEEVTALIQQAIQETGALGSAGVGKVMGWLAPKIRGRADGSDVSMRVKELLNP
jgi:uncharacterized protein YqeY